MRVGRMGFLFIRKTVSTSSSELVHWWLLVHSRHL
jgi:hypothetical protein